MMTETTRKSLLDVVEGNLKSINYSTYITRLLYFGEYFHSSDELQEVMGKIVNALNGNSNENFITGLLLVYPRFYMHLLEAPEDIIYMHFKDIYENKNKEGKFGKAIILLTCHHVYHRFFIDWYHVYTLAPSLLEKIENQTLEEIKKQISNCCIKFYHLCEYISTVMRENADEVAELLFNLNEKIPQYLPEMTVLEFLLNVKSNVLTIVEDYLRIYSDVPFIQFYGDTIWPPPTDNIPRYDALDKCVDRLTDEDDVIRKKI
ncbi:testis-expressed protein 47-like isoform X1 [Polistes fuscatus]|uniref:testis-expressed protein 47-like isoform X1 n=2 Tax=Polistes fuscatus TaxID=30207 RepID=UPI001CA9B01C|nr:testis-expressed protein 47-like isoform X1 [Polistes fuscatus]